MERDKMHATRKGSRGRLETLLIIQPIATGIHMVRSMATVSAANGIAELSGKAYCRKHNLIPHEASCGKSTKYKHLFKRQRALIERCA